MVPSLVSLCIQALIPFPEHVHKLFFRLNPRSSVSWPEDPRLWAVLVQVYADLPFRVYSLALDDIHIPLLQQIPCSVQFSLVTVLECNNFTDYSVSQLRHLHTLTALDISGANITSDAVQNLAPTLQPIKGPWHLRILSLRNCRKVNNQVYEHLDAFPLLSVVDLRGTGCTASSSSKFQVSDDDDLFYPNPLLKTLQALQSTNPQLHSAPNTSAYILHIDALRSKSVKAKHRPPPPGTIQDSFVVLPPPGSSYRKITTGHSHILEKREKAQEDALKHDQNKDAWYERNFGTGFVCIFIF